MFLGPKTTMCINHIITVEFDYLYWGRKPTSNTIEKIFKQGAYKDTTDVRAFLEDGSTVSESYLYF